MIMIKTLKNLLFFQETLDLDNTPLKGLTSLPLLMERLMGEHSAWIKRAWQGRDEAAAAAA